MPRLHLVEPKTDTGLGADILNGPLKSNQINIFKHLATNPGVLKAFLAFNQGVKTGGLTDKEHEIVVLVASQHTGCDYCLAAHTQIAKGLGASEDDVLNYRQGRADDDRTQAIIDFTNAILDTKGYVSDEQLQDFKSAGFDDAAVIEVIAELTVTYFTNTFNHVNETEVDFPVAASV